MTYPVPADQRLNVGDLVQLVVAAFNVQGEVHTVTDAPTPTYRVRIINAPAEALAAGVRIGDFVDREHAQVTQIGLDDSLLDQIAAQGVEPAENETEGELLGRKWAILFGDPRITKYLSGQDRLNLSTVSTAASSGNRSVQGRTAVTPAVFNQIVANRDRLEPPLRPELGERGRVTWMTIAGNPVIGKAAEEKEVDLVVQVFPGIRWADIPVIGTAELDRRVALTRRRRVAALSAVVDEFLRVCPTWYTGEEPKRKRSISDEHAGQLAAVVREFAHTHAVELATFDSAATTDVLQAGCQRLLELLAAAVKGKPGNKLFVSFVDSQRAIHAAMWTDLGAHVATLPKQVARVVFTGSPLSKDKDGEYLIVASRRFLYVLSADGHAF